MGLLKPNWRSGLQPRISNLRNLPVGLAGTGSLPRRPVRQADE